MKVVVTFQSTRSAGSATQTWASKEKDVQLFQSTRSAGSATAQQNAPKTRDGFQSTRSAGSATGEYNTDRAEDNISIHALRRERDRGSRS